MSEVNLSGSGCLGKLGSFCNSVLVTFLNRNDPHSPDPIWDKNVVIAYMPVVVSYYDDRLFIMHLIAL
jgi:hypothetical protein